MGLEIETEKPGGNRHWKIALAVICLAALQGLASAFGTDVGHFLWSLLEYRLVLY